MSSPLVLLRSTIATALEALTPPDRTERTYHQATGRKRLTGAAGDRSFRFLPPGSRVPIAECGSEATHAEWSVDLELRIAEAGRGAGDLFDAVANESNLIARTIETTSSWPAGVLSVETGPTSIERVGDDGDVLCTLNLVVLTSEAD